MIPGRHVFASYLLSLTATVSAAAHPIVIHRGAVEWKDQNLRLVLVLDRHSLVHETAAFGGAAAPERVARALANSLHIVSHRCDHIIAKRVVISKDGRKTTCDYIVPDGVTTLALTHHPDGGLAALSRQFQLRWSPPQGRRSRTIRVTSGGNHVVIRRNGVVDGFSASHDPFSEPLLRIRDRSNGSAVRFQIDFPCTLLATWPNLIACRDGAITGRLFQRCRPGIAEWTRKHISIRGPAAPPPRVSVEQVDLIAPTGDILTNEVDTKYSVYTTRVRMRIRLEGVDAAPWTELTWSGFSSVVLRLPVIREGDASPAPLGILTPAQAIVRIVHADPPQAMIRQSPSVETVRPR